MPLTRLATAVALCIAIRTAGGQAIANGHVRAVFDDRGLHSLTDLRDRREYAFERDGFSVTVDNETLTSESLARPVRSVGPRLVSYRYTAGSWTLTVRYELRPDWAFVSKQI